MRDNRPFVRTYLALHGFFSLLRLAALHAGQCALGQTEETQTLTVPRYGGVLVGPSLLRQIFNDTDSETLWLIVGAPDKEFPDGKIDLQQHYPVAPTQLPPELSGVECPPKG